MRDLSDTAWSGCGEEAALLRGAIWVQKNRKHLDQIDLRYPTFGTLLSSAQGSDPLQSRYFWEKLINEDGACTLRRAIERRLHEDA